MHKLLDDINDQLSLAKQELDSALAIAKQHNQRTIIEYIVAAQRALMRIHQNEEDVVRKEKEEFQKIIVLEEEEEREKSMLVALQNELNTL